jgi:hypothetical protein
VSRACLLCYSSLEDSCQQCCRRATFLCYEYYPTKSRNRLSSISAHKATHIAMNIKAFKRSQIKVDEDLEKYLVMLEDEQLANDLANTRQMLRKRKRVDSDEEEELDLAFW